MNEPLSLAEEDEVLVGYVSDLYALLRAIDEVMPRDAVLSVEGTSVAPDIASVLESREAPHPPRIAPNTLGPNNHFFHLPLAGTNLSDLRVLAEQHAEPEVADHLVVYRDRQILLWAGDADRCPPDGGTAPPHTYGRTRTASIRPQTSRAAAPQITRDDPSPISSDHAPIRRSASCAEERPVRAP